MSLYSDICGKNSPPTLNGEQYIIHFLDEKSGYIFCYLAQHKSEAFKRFQEVRARINNLGTSTVKVFATDGGGEYISTEFKDFLKDKGIQQSISPPNTHERVGKSERLNKILFDAARAMLKERRLPRRFWGFAVLYAVYIRNRTVKNGRDRTRHELFLGNQPSLKHCLPFGSKVIYHNHDPHIKKLDDRAFEGMFIGFDENNHAYKILDLESGKVKLSRDVKPRLNEVIFTEESDWDQDFLEENDNNWFQGGTNVPAIYDIFNEPEDDEVQPILIQNNNNNNIQPNIQPNIQLDDESFDEDNEDIMGNPIINNRDNNNDHRYPLRSRQLVLSTTEINNILNLDDVNTPQSYKEAMKSPQQEQWKESIKEEQESLIKLDTFEVVPRPAKKPVIKSRYVFKIKIDADGSIARYKCRIVAKGYTQTQGVDYFETFSPALRLDSFRYLISTARLKKFKIHHLDVQTAFLNGELAEEIYMEIPEAFESVNADRKTHVFRLKKSIYGLKQASRVWNEKFTNTITAMGFTQSAADPCIFIKSNAENQPAVIIGIFVDDCFVLGEDNLINNTTEQLMKKFNMHNLGELSYALGIKVEQQQQSTQLSQTAYVDKLLDKFNMQNATPVFTPLPEKPQQDETNNEKFKDINLYQQLIGSLIYLSNATRPDISYAVGYLARSMQAPTEADFMNGKRVLRYLKGTRTLALNYNNNEQMLFGYSDASYAEEKDRRSIGGYVFMQAGAAITWRSTKQEITALSSMEAEYIALAESGKEAQWLRKIQSEFFPTFTEPTTVCEDNQSAIKLATNPIHSSRSKHIDVRYHYIRELVKIKAVHVKFTPGTEMVADIMTKSLGKILHKRFLVGMGLA